LMYAAMYNRIEITRKLLVRGAAIDIRNEHGATALHLAAARGNVKIVYMLIMAGATINTLGYGLTPLMAACAHFGVPSTSDKYFIIIALLLAAGADPNAMMIKYLSE